MKNPSIFIMLIACATSAMCQQVKFNRVIDRRTNFLGGISSIAQDRQGYIWIGASIGGSTGRGGLYKYDGTKIVSFVNNPKNSNSLASDWVECMIVDSSNVVWIGTFGKGLDRYDASTNTFTLFSHNATDNNSLKNDTVTAILEDHKGNLWVGTRRGLDLFDKKTGRFTHYTNKLGDSTSLSYDHVRIIYEDRQGTLWIGCGSPFPADGDPPESGGLNRFNAGTGTFTRYMHDATDPGSLANNKVRALLEDSKGNFWVGTAGDGLHTMDRTRGTFTHYYYDSTHQERLSRPPLDRQNQYDHITFIKEDITGAIWIGGFLGGVNRYDPGTKKITHYGAVVQGNSTMPAKDTAIGFNDINPWTAFTSKDGLFWIATLNGSVYNINPSSTVIPYYPVNAVTYSLYAEPNTVLWLATDKGLLRRDLVNRSERIWKHDPLDNNSLCNDTVVMIRKGDDNKLWLATFNGLTRFDPSTDNFITYRHNERDRNSLSSNQLACVFIDYGKNVWIGTFQTGLDKFNPKTNEFTHFENRNNDSTSLNGNFVICINQDRENTLWIGTGNGISRLDNTNGHFKQYMKRTTILSICVDEENVVWAGTPEGLYRYDKSSDLFLPYDDPASQISIGEVLHVMEDNKRNLWVNTVNGILKINKQRTEVRLYGRNYGIHVDSIPRADNIQAAGGELFFGDQAGYYSFFPEKLKENSVPPLLAFSAFRVRGKEMKPAIGGLLEAGIWDTREIKLKYDQNIFSLDFIAMHYDGTDNVKYQFMLENYDNNWHNIGTDHTAYFFNVPPGSYVFHAKAVKADGVSAERTLTIIITPPWWRTWWAYCLYGLFLAALIYGAYRWQKSRLLKAERERTRERELAQAKEIQKAYHELEQAHEALKATQAQLIQSEKMASLGELTAGIAHEIQNPLNFVNNFSEVNNELIEEIKSQKSTLKPEELDSLLSDISQNLQKISNHGKRADAIVKGMLQHSRTSSGQKELTDINSLCDEYLRLAYHGLRAKDKSFNAEIKTDFDSSFGKINIVPQDIGRVLVNLLNNAFYAVGERQKACLPDRQAEGVGYRAEVIVKTKKAGDKILISVGDNGVGIPQKNLDKIFQPFFTTKPTGQGTGLGLSLAYDIVKANGGVLRVETKEGEGSEFTIQLPTASNIS